MRINQEAVIDAAAELADRKGLNAVTLKAVAEQIGIRPPSLYNHIASLDDLLRAVAHQGMRQMNEQMARAAIGVAGDEAILAVGMAYFRYPCVHPGVYETIQWALWHGDSETTEIFAEYRTLLGAVVQSLRLNNPDSDEIVTLLTGVLHGITSMQVGAAIQDEKGARPTVATAIETVLAGIHQKYQ